MSNTIEVPKINSRWMRQGYDKTKELYNGYTVEGITNMENRNDNHPPQVIYRGDNRKLWSLPLSRWPGNLVKEPHQRGLTLSLDS